MMHAASVDSSIIGLLRNGSSTTGNIASLTSIDVVMHVSGINCVILFLSVSSVYSNSSSSPFEVAALVI